MKHEQDLLKKLQGPVIAYVDGACSGNPGPCGIGAVVMNSHLRFELSEFLGQGTNNIAELTAILRVLEALAHMKYETIEIFSDSKYSIGVLTQNWKAKANRDLITLTRNALAEFENISFQYVPGHAGHEWNERADELAVQAVEMRRSAGWRVAG